MVKVKVSKGFSITLPIEVAKELKIREGESFLVDVSSKNTIVLIRLLTERERLADEAFGMWEKERIYPIAWNMLIKCVLNGQRERS